MEGNLTKQEIFEILDDSLEKCLEHLKTEYTTIKAGRANPKVLDRVMVNYYGSMTPLNQMSNITSPDPRTLMVSIWDMGVFKDVRKALSEADLGLGMNDDGKVIRLTFPILTEERRKEICKTVKKVAEENKVACRNSRRDALDEFKALKKDSLITEDEMKSAEKDVQTRIDNAIAKIDKIAQEKEKEIMTV